jgi:hypothetical protein
MKFGRQIQTYWRNIPPLSEKMAYTEAGSTMFLRRFGNHLPDYTFYQ